MAKSRSLKDAASDPVVEKKKEKVRNIRNKSDGRGSLPLILIAFAAGFVGGFLARRFLRIM